MIAKLRRCFRGRRCWWFAYVQSNYIIWLTGFWRKC